MWRRANEKFGPEQDVEIYIKNREKGEEDEEKKENAWRVEDILRGIK